jgi:hypothetical protein
MGEWKAQISLRVRQDLRREMEEFVAEGDWDLLGTGPNAHSDGCGGQI